MSLTATVTGEQIDAIANGELTEIIVPCFEIEFIEQDGLLTSLRRVVGLEQLGTTVATHLGLSTESGPLIRVYLAREGGSDADSHPD